MVSLECMVLLTSCKLNGAALCMMYNMFESKCCLSFRMPTIVSSKWVKFALCMVCNI